jgi:aspartyl-tRNA synthetase
MVKYCSKVPNESIIDITGVVTKPKEAVAGCTQKIEIVVKQFWIINKSAPILPF